MRFARAVVRVYGDTLFEFPETVGQLQTACDLMMLEREGGRGVNVLALVSADYRFRWHSAFVGGNDVDASLWNKTSLKQRIARLEWPPEDSRQAINEPQEESLAMRPIILVDGTFAGSPVSNAAGRLCGQVLQKLYLVAQLDLPSKLLFNKIHDSGRKVVEQAFGQVVGRFGIFAQPVRWLAESTPEDLADVIKCAFILHNLCIDMHDVFDGDDDDGGGGEQRDWGLDENIETTRMVMTEYRTNVSREISSLICMIGFLKDWCKVANVAMKFWRRDMTVMMSSCIAIGGLCNVSTRFGRLGGLRQNMKWSSTSPFCPKMKGQDLLL
eukprot:g77345.t1